MACGVWWGHPALEHPGACQIVAASHALTQISVRCWAPAITQWWSCRRPTTACYQAQQASWLHCRPQELSRAGPASATEPDQAGDAPLTCLLLGTLPLSQQFSTSWHRPLSCHCFSAAPQAQSVLGRISCPSPHTPSSPQVLQATSPPYLEQPQTQPNHSNPPPKHLPTLVHSALTGFELKLVWF